MAIDVLTEEVAQNLEEVAAVTRGISGKGVGLVLGGIVIGAAAGFYFGYRFNREKIKAQAFAESAFEIETIREEYRRRSEMTFTTTEEFEKPSIEEVIEEKGYSSVVPPDVVIGPSGRGLKPPVPVGEQGFVVREPEPLTITDPVQFFGDRKWDQAKEILSRTTEEPYVIHQDEVAESDYRGVQLTYYAGDDVLVDENDKVLPHSDIVVGQGNLKFGHGTDDPDVVFVRNDKHEIDMEITRVPTKYEEEVLGISDDENN